MDAYLEDSVMHMKEASLCDVAKVGLEADLYVLAHNRKPSDHPRISPQAVASPKINSMRALERNVFKELRVFLWNGKGADLIDDIFRLPVDKSVPEVTKSVAQRYPREKRDLRRFPDIRGLVIGCESTTMKVKGFLMLCAED
ncbi:hypothetical protein PoB_000543900 [Plakobranchus ocellatus]|uniref:Uncharacterized protein n=1 Tax=Plakobranchus ocellatus TaxID=259542 RepID=A0AAV3Y9I9_9GAST|nr:hypothetical protein PoB_000543900 [Plakobranchus ocellatus]